MLLNIDNTVMILKNFISDKIIIFIIMIFIIILSTLLVNIKGNKKKKNYIYEIKQNDTLLLNQKEISNKEEIQKIAYNLLSNIKVKKMNYDLKAIKSITTDDVYNLYERQINTLKVKKQKNIVQNIKYINSYITKIDSTNNVINLRLIIECYDYVMDSSNNIIKGKYNKKMMQTYEIEILNKNENYLIKKLELLYEREI